jgi:hypothetical protein
MHLIVRVNETGLSGRLHRRNWHEMDSAAASGLFALEDEADLFFSRGDFRN